ncbi:MULTISPECIES: hypothetical protein [Pseudomonas]|uniref:hypothetical protein n=1 Tax=Pseudomonas TaxID=286 RepID=UPI0003DD9032|nr:MULTISPECIES: hypothetical protein [Pseudomonas]ETK22710.1 hypothetical protein H096_14073 [Pseudomonas sp. FH1]MDB1111915.1 hypothetical protein [Pseudomonas extremaustralis]
MTKPPLPPFTLEEDLAKLPALFPSSLMVEQFGGYLVNIHKISDEMKVRTHWIGVCNGYINALKAADLLNSAQVPELREIVEWAAQRSYVE